MTYKISVVVPLYNEANNIEPLVNELYPVLEKRSKDYGNDYEVLLVDDGSSDNTVLKIKQMNLTKTKLIILNRNFGQHRAILAGFEKSSGQAVITLDADLQNPPSEINKLLDKFEQGYDLVATKRKNRNDNWFRTYISKMMNIINAKIIGNQQSDFGCMLRLYSKEIVKNILKGQTKDIFIPAKGTYYAKNITEIEVEHKSRLTGKSKYSLFKLLGLEFDIYTEFSKSPMTLLILFGMIISALGLSFSIFLIIRRFIVGPEVEGVFTLFAILFFFIGAQFLAFGLIGEYLSRIYQILNKSPVYIIHKVEEFK